MYNVSEDFKTACRQKSRHYELYVTYKNEGVIYTLSMDNIISLKINKGRTKGAFTLGDTICPTLSLVTTLDADIKSSNEVKVYVKFKNVEDNLLLGIFYIDETTITLYNKNYKAYGKLLQFSKEYESNLTYPATVQQIFNEISQMTNVPLAEDLTLINNVNITALPIKATNSDGTTQYYTRREMLGYLACLQGGSAYIDNNYCINFTRNKTTGEEITLDQTVTRTINNELFTIKNVLWNTSGVSYSIKDNYEVGSVEFFNPLSFLYREQVLINLNRNLRGKSFSNITLKKQGFGYYELGDMVDFVADDETYTLLISGISYDFSNGFFTETLYSVASSEMQDEYAGNVIVSGNVDIDLNKFHVLGEFNLNELELDDTEQLVCEIDYKLNTSTVPLLCSTIPFTVTTAGIFEMSLYNNDVLLQSFQQVVESGVNFKSVSYPLQELSRRQHTTRLTARMVTGSATIGLKKANMTITATGLGYNEFDGFLNFSEEIEKVISSNKVASIKNISESFEFEFIPITNVSLEDTIIKAISTPITATIQQPIENIPYDIANAENTSNTTIEITNKNFMAQSGALTISNISLTGYIGTTPTQITVIQAKLESLTVDFDYSNVLIIECGDLSSYDEILYSIGDINLVNPFTGDTLLLGNGSFTVS